MLVARNHMVGECSPPTGRPSSCPLRASVKIEALHLVCVLFHRLLTAHKLKFRFPTVASLAPCPGKHHVLALGTYTPRPRAPCTQFPLQASG